MAQKQKLLVCGDVEGKFNALFKRLESINNKSGPFDMLLCVGNFFGINNKEFEPYKSGAKKVPVPTYVLGPNKEEHISLYPEEESELCPNVHYLGKRGLYTNSGGVKIAYISGIASTDSDKPFTYNLDDATSLSDVCKRGNPRFRGVDILLTSQWPTNIMNADSKPPTKTINLHSDIPAWLNMQLRPRYHISGLEGLYYERPPYRSGSTMDTESMVDLATRFVGLARVDNPFKQKWIYALNLTPLDKMELKELIQRTTDEIPCPFSATELELRLFKSKQKPKKTAQFFYDMEPEPSLDNQLKPKRQRVLMDQSTCWFCLSSPKVEKHLVVAVGDHAYLALAKGGIVDDHLLICPVQHHRCTVGLDESISKEIQQFKSAVNDYYAQQKKVPVFFERNYKSFHLQVHVIPISINMSTNLKDMFQDEAVGHGFQLIEIESDKSLENVVKPGKPYFHVEFPNGDALYSLITPSVAFPLDFGREVLASEAVLNLPDRTDWRKCPRDRDDENEIVQQIRKKFEPFDFTA